VQKIGQDAGAEAAATQEIGRRDSTALVVDQFKAGANDLELGIGREGL